MRMREFTDCTGCFTEESRTQIRQYLEGLGWTMGFGIVSLTDGPIFHYAYAADPDIYQSGIECMVLLVGRLVRVTGSTPHVIARVGCGEPLPFRTSIGVATADVEVCCDIARTFFGDAPNPASSRWYKNTGAADKEYENP